MTTISAYDAEEATQIAVDLSTAQYHGANITVRLPFGEQQAVLCMDKRTLAGLCRQVLTELHAQGYRARPIHSNGSGYLLVEEQ